MKNFLIIFFLSFFVACPVWADDFFQQGALIVQSTDIVSSAGTTVLTKDSDGYTSVSGVTTHTIVLPDATTLVPDRVFNVVNQSTGSVAVEFTDNSPATTLTAMESAWFKVVDIGTAVGTWSIVHLMAGIAVESDPLALHLDGSTTMTGDLELDPNLKIRLLETTGAATYTEDEGFTIDGAGNGVDFNFNSNSAIGLYFQINNSLLSGDDTDTMYLAYNGRSGLEWYQAGWGGFKTIPAFSVGTDANSGAGGVVQDLVLERGFDGEQIRITATDIVLKDDILMSEVSGSRSIKSENNAVNDAIPSQTIELLGGDKTGATASGNAGLVNIVGGNVTSGGTGSGGGVSLSGGTAVAGAGGGGDITFNGGLAGGATSGRGGDILLNPGAAAGSGSDGEVVIGLNDILRFTGVSSGDWTFQAATNGADFDIDSKNDIGIYFQLNKLSDSPDTTDIMYIAYNGAQTPGREWYQAGWGGFKAEPAFQAGTDANTGAGGVVQDFVMERGFDGDQIRITATDIKFKDDILMSEVSGSRSIKSENNTVSDATPSQTLELLGGDKSGTTASGNAGLVNIVGGNASGGTSSGSGGGVTLSGGTASGTGAGGGGDITFNGGLAGSGTSGDGGDVAFNPGAASGSGDNGVVSISPNRKLRFLETTGSVSYAANEGFTIDGAGNGVDFNFNSNSAIGLYFQINNSLLSGDDTDTMYLAYNGRSGLEWYQAGWGGFKTIPAFSVGTDANSGAGGVVQDLVLERGFDGEQIRIKTTGVQYTVPIIGLDNSIVDASVAGDLTVRAGNKTASTGNGGDLNLSGGTSSGGTVGNVVVTVGDLDLTDGDLFVDGVQVVSNRVTGYGDPTGTTDRSTFATSTVTTENLAEFVKALYEDMQTHGLIGN